MAESNNAKFESHPLDGSEDAARKCLKTSEGGFFCGFFTVDISESKPCTAKRLWIFVEGTMTSFL
jgi:hypothetical protein